MGPRLTKLQLHYVDSMDLAAIAVVASCCHNLTSLQLGAVVSRAGGGYEEEPYLAQMRRAGEAELKRHLVPLFELEEVVVGGPCPEQELITLLSLGLNLRRIRLGATCCVSDLVVQEVRGCQDLPDSSSSQVLVTNQLQYLEAFEVRDAPQLGITTVEALMETCPRYNNGMEKIGKDLELQIC